MPKPKRLIGLLKGEHLIIIGSVDYPVSYE